MQSFTFKLLSTVEQLGPELLKVITVIRLCHDVACFKYSDYKR